MIKYCFSDGPLTIKAAKRADPQKIGEALEKITSASGGKLTPQATVEAAKNPRNPLHKHFEWDDAKCGIAYRLEQAREIIRLVRIENDDEIEMPRAFLSVASQGGTSYRQLADIKGSAELQIQIMKQADRDLEAFQRRYRDLVEICDEVQTIRDRLTAKRAAATSRVGANAA